MKRDASRVIFGFVIVVVIIAAGVHAQDHLYREDGWAKLPDGRRLGQMSAIDIDRAGSVWALDRCGANSCAEAVAADAAGNVYWVETNGMIVRKFFKR